MANAVIKTQFETEMTFGDGSKLILSKGKSGEGILQVVSGDGKVPISRDDLLKLLAFADVGVKLLQTETKDK